MYFKELNKDIGKVVANVAEKIYFEKTCEYKITRINAGCGCMTAKFVEDKNRIEVIFIPPPASKILRETYPDKDHYRTQKSIQIYLDLPVLDENGDVIKDTTFVSLSILCDIYDELPDQLP